MCQRYERDYSGRSKQSGVEYDCNRAEAYKLSEEMIEKVRQQEIRTKLIPSRTKAVFFDPRENDIDDYCQEEDEYGQKVCDFGYGKDTMLSVASCDLPCECGFGSTDQSDSVFADYLHRLEQGEDPHLSDEYAEQQAKEFWKTAKIYNHKSNDAYTWDEQPEVWCPCVIPPRVIKVEQTPIRRRRDY